MCATHNQIITRKLSVTQSIIVKDNCHKVLYFLSGSLQDDLCSRQEPNNHKLQTEIKTCGVYLDIIYHIIT